MSIRARITLFGLLVVVAVLACFGGAVFVLIASGLPRDQDDKLTQRVAQAKPRC